MATTSGLGEGFCAMAEKKYEYTAKENVTASMMPSSIGVKVLEGWRFHSAYPGGSAGGMGEMNYVMIFEREVTSPA